MYLGVGRLATRKPAPLLDVSEKCAWKVSKSGQSDIERLLGTRALFQGAGVETATAHLGHREGKFAEAGHDGLWFETIGIVVAICGAFVRLGIEKVGTLDFARFVDQDAQGFARAIASNSLKAQEDSAI